MNDTEHPTPADDGHQPRKRPVCDWCKTDRVMWLMVAGKWRLCGIEDGKPHVCARPTEADTFTTDTEV